MSISLTQLLILAAVLGLGAFLLTGGIILYRYLAKKEREDRE